MYDGQWHRGQREGRGEERLVGAQPEVYTGDFLAGRRHGHGVLRRPGGWRFEGAFEAGMQRGEGTLYLGAASGAPAGASESASGEFAAPATLAGSAAPAARGEPSAAMLWKDDTPAAALSASAVSDPAADGDGWMSSVDAVHGNEFVEFVLHGDGLRTYANGDAYEGAMLRGVPHGSGVLHYADGGSLTCARPPPLAPPPPPLAHAPVKPPLQSPRVTAWHRLPVHPTFALSYCATGLCSSRLAQCDVGEWPRRGRRRADLSVR